MTGPLLIVAGLCLVSIPAVFGLPHSMGGRESTRLIGAALMAGIAAIQLGLVLVALPALLRAQHFDFAEVCVRALTELSAGQNAVAWMAAGLAVTVGIRGSRAAWHARRAARGVVVEPWLGLHEDRGDYELVVIPTHHLMAVGVPARRPQVLISEGLIAHLDAEQLDVVIRHEAAHHRARHWRYSMLAISIEQALKPLPMVSDSSQALRTAIEAWADEDAASGSKRRRTLLRSALAAVVRGRSSEHRRADLCAALAERTVRLERTLSRRSATSRLVARGPLVFLAAALLVSALSGVAGIHHLAAVMGYCPK